MLSTNFNEIFGGVGCSLSFYYAPPLIDGGIKRCFCLTSDVCLTSACRVHRA